MINKQNIYARIGFTTILLPAGTVILRRNKKVVIMFQKGGKIVVPEWKFKVLSL